MKNFFDEDVDTTLSNEKNKKKLNSWWVEKYRPITMDDFIGNDSIKKQVKKDIDSQDISHILLHGKAGSGKTTLAKILSMNISSDRLYINASDENSVDDIRTKVKGFASSVGYVGKKIIVLDESDYMSTNAQAALRNLMETYSQHTRFILTCNYVEKIIEPLISRCQLYTLSPPSKKDIAKRLSDILISESIKFELADIAFIVKAYYPDIRKIINNAQKQSTDGVLSINKEEIIEADFKLKILEILKDKSKSKKDSFTEIRQLIADNNIYNFIDVYKLLFDNINDYAVGNIATVILILAEMQYKSSISVDQEILFMSTILQILDKIR